MNSASDATRRRYARRAHSISCLLAVLLALSLAGPAAAQMPEMPPMPELPEQPELPSTVPDPSLDASFQASVGGGVAAPAEPAAPVEPVTPGSPPDPTAGGAPAPPGPVPEAAPAPPPEPVAQPLAAPVPEAAPAPAPPTHLNLDLRVLSPGDNGRVSTPGLNGGTGASPGMPEDWTWNWNWDLPGCESNAGPSTAGWNWNWNWGCGGATELPAGTDAQELLELVADQLPTAAPDLAATDLEGPGMPLGEDADTNVRAGVSDEGGAPSGGRHTVREAPAGAPFAAPLVAAAPMDASVPVPIEPRGRPSDVQRSDSTGRPRRDDDVQRDPFPFPAPLAAQSAGGGTGGAGSGGLVLLLAALVGMLALVPPPPGGRIAAWQQRLRSLLSSSRLERPG